MVILKFNYIKSKYFIIIAKLARLPSASIIWPIKSPYIKAILFLQFNKGRVGGKWHLLFTNKIGSVQKLSYLLFEIAVHFSDTIYYRTNETAALCFFTFSYCLSFCTFYVCLAFPVGSQSVFSERICTHKHWTWLISRDFIITANTAKHFCFTLVLWRFELFICQTWIFNDPCLLKLSFPFLFVFFFLFFFVIAFFFFLTGSRICLPKIQIS